MQLLEMMANMGNKKLSEHSPRVTDKRGFFVYKKGTVVGRFGKQDIDEGFPMYLYTNRKDRDVYERRYLGREEQTFYLGKDIRVPSVKQQIVELYNFTKDPYVLDEPFEYWRDHINQGGNIADGYFRYMESNGYDGLIDYRNAGLEINDPILILNPKKMS